jgi:hypothetical protein
VEHRLKGSGTSEEEVRVKHRLEGIEGIDGRKKKRVADEDDGEWPC